MSLDVAQATVHPEKVRPASAVSRWSMDDADVSSGTIVDSWGSNDGTINGATTGVSGVGYTGEAFSFDGSDDYVEIPDSSDFYFDTSSWSVALWFSSTDTSESGNVFIAKSQGGSGHKWWAIRPKTDGTLDFVVDDDGSIGFTTVATTETYMDGAWHNVVAVVNASSLRLELYVDGILTATTSISGFDSLSNTYPITMMKRHYDVNQLTAGDLDEVRIYSEALSQQQIWQLYSIGTHAPWRLSQA